LIVEDAGKTESQRGIGADGVPDDDTASCQGRGWILIHCILIHCTYMNDWTIEAQERTAVLTVGVCVRNLFKSQPEDGVNSHKCRLYGPTPSMFLSSSFYNVNMIDTKKSVEKDFENIGFYCQEVLH